MRADTDFHRPHVVPDFDQRAPEDEAVQALRLVQEFLVPLRAELLLVRIVDADAEARRADANEIGVAKSANRRSFLALASRRKNAGINFAAS